MKRYALFTLLVLVALYAPRHASGQALVLDAANLIQTTATALSSVDILANSVLELTGLDGIEVNEDFASEMEELGNLVNEARGLSYDIASLQAQVTTLFDFDTAPDNTTALHERLAAIRRVVYLSYLDAMRTQTLITTTLSAVRHLTRLVAGIESFVGNMQANQTLLQVDATLTKKLTELQIQTVTFQRAQSVERLTEALTIQSMQNIEDAIYEDHPK